MKKSEAKKEAAAAIEFPILKIIGTYLDAGGRIEKRNNLVSLIDNRGEYVVGGETLQKMMVNAIFALC